MTLNLFLMAMVLSIIVGSATAFYCCLKKNCSFLSLLKVGSNLTSGDQKRVDEQEQLLKQANQEGKDKIKKAHKGNYESMMNQMEKGRLEEGATSAQSTPPLVFPSRNDSFAQRKNYYEREDEQKVDPSIKNNMAHTLHGNTLPEEDIVEQAEKQQKEIESQYSFV